MNWKVRAISFAIFFLLPWFLTFSPDWRSFLLFPPFFTFLRRSIHKFRLLLSDGKGRNERKNGRSNFSVLRSLISHGTRGKKSGNESESVREREREREWERWSCNEISIVKGKLPIWAPRFFHGSQRNIVSLIFSSSGRPCSKHAKAFEPLEIRNSTKYLSSVESHLPI